MEKTHYIYVKILPKNKKYALLVFNTQNGIHTLAQSVRYIRYARCPEGKTRVPSTERLRVELLSFHYSLVGHFAKVALSGCGDCITELSLNKTDKDIKVLALSN